MAVVLFGLLLAGTAAGGDVPGLLTTQGVLRSPGGSPVNGVYAITFRIYSAQTGGQLLWSETRPAVAVSAGLYSEVLGTINPIPTTLFSSTANAWMTLSIAGEPELPRSQITSVAFALHARSALTAGTATNAETAETADFAAATDVADNAFNLQCTGCVSEAELAFEVVTPQEVGPIALDAVDDAGIYLPVTGGGLSGGLDVAGVVTAAAFVGNGSGLTGISSPQGACANGWLVSGITAAGVLVCTKAATAVTSVDGLAGGTIAGDLDVTGSVTSEGSLVCTEAGNCPDADSLAELLCEAGDVPVWDGDAWICGAVAQTLPGAPCQDGTSVLTWTGDAFGCKLITGIGPSAGAAQGFEVRDEWGYSWDGLMRPLATYTSAAAACEAAGARLPTPTELFRVSQVKSKLFGPLASTDFLWSAVQFSASGHVAVNLSTAEVSYTVDSAARPYRCVWPDNKATSFTGDYCYGPAGAECFPLTLENDRYVFDRYDR
ncbi:MAG: hypothetical protein FJ098_15325, partial [Deltaproteobacteria bacterium]|nr:hypothetical protein [Deltaproteobacteria bacterium]